MGEEAEVSTDEKQMRKRLLFVDDEPDLLTFYERVFVNEYEVVTASSGPDGLDAIENKGPFAIVVADLNMPDMNGIEFLDKARRVVPDTVRLMLTGFASEETAIDAVNRGDVFKFLTKPVRVRELVDSVEAAVRRFQVIRAERELLEKTLSGSIEMMVEALSLASPGIFGRAARLRDDMALLCQALGMDDLWELETSAMLSQIGLLTAPDTLIEKIMRDESLTQAEQDTYRRQAEVGADLVRKVPRLEPVAENIRLQYKNFDGTGFPTDDDSKGTDIPHGARMLRLLHDMQVELNRGLAREAVMKRLKEQESYYDPDLLEALERSDAGHYSAEVLEVSTLGIEPGTVLAEDLYNSSDVLILRAGQEVSSYVAEKLQGFAAAREIPATIRIVAPS